MKVDIDVLKRRLTESRDKEFDRVTTGGDMYEICAAEYAWAEVFRAVHRFENPDFRLKGE